MSFGGAPRENPAGLGHTASPAPMTTLRALSFVLASCLGFSSLVACASQDPGAYEIVPRKTAGGPPVIPTTPTGNPPPTDGGTPPPPTDGGTSGSVVFGTAFVPGNGGTDKLQTVHMGNGGPQNIDAAKTSDCLGCHGTSGTAMNKFLAAGVASEANAEVGVKLSNGTLRTTRSGAAPDTIFTIDLVAGDNIAGARTGVRNATRFKDMSTPLTSGGCNQGACHGGAQGVIFKP